MRKLNYEQLAQFDGTALRELEDGMVEQIRREAEAKKAEETRKAKKRRKRGQSR